MISTARTVAGVNSETSPAVGLRCSATTELAAGNVRSAAGNVRSAAPSTGTGLPIAGTAVRLRGLLAAAGTTDFYATGVPFGTDVLPSVQSPAVTGLAVAGVPARHTSTTPGDLPPEDPLS